MRIVYQLMLATILPAVLIWIVGINATRVSERSLRNAIEATAATRAREVMDEIDWIIQTRATTWQAYLRTNLVLETLRESNQSFAELPDPAAVVAQRDANWQAAPADEDNDLMSELINNELARDLRGWLQKLDESAGYTVFGEVFVTNRYGANAAQTHRTSDYRQDDEPWWQEAVANGVHIGDVEFDESAGLYSIDICLSANDDNGQLLGVMKAVMNIQELISIIDNPEDRVGADSHLILFNRDRRIIREANVDAEPLRDGSAYFVESARDSGATEFVGNLFDPSGGESLLCAFAESRGHGSFEGMGWIVLDARKSSVVFAPINRLRNQTIALAIVATMLVALVGWFIARSITRPLDDLLDGTGRIGQGELDYRIPVAGSNEVAKLGSAFNHMAENLQSMVLDLKTKEDELKDQYEKLESQSETLASQEEMLDARAAREKLFEAIRDAVTRLNLASDNILTTTSTQALGSQAQAVAVSETATTMSEVAQIADQTAARANHMVNEAKEAETHADSGRQALSKSIEAIDSVKTQVESTAEHILSLAERAQAIGEITATVNDIAEQTNVLALNAAVEASRAGEHGKGFAVVAAEVKALAQQSKDSTRQVRGILTEILEATTTAVMSTEQGTLAVTEAGNVATETSEFISQLLATISDSARSANQIASSASQQAAGVIQLNQTMKDMETSAAKNAEALKRIEQSAIDLHHLSAELAGLTSEN